MIRLCPIPTSATATGEGLLNRRLREDPRLSAGQLRAMSKLVQVDPNACCEGLDQKMRPVIHARLPGPKGVTRYALLRNGDPAAVEGSLIERWR